MIHQKDPLKWTDEEINEQLVSDTSNFDSRYNPKRKNPNLSLILEKASTVVDNQYDNLYKNPNNNDAPQTGLGSVKENLDRLKDFRPQQSTPNPNLYLKELSDIAKFYTEEEKYSGSQDRFDFK
ncbi:hypothetical protein GcC1_192032, partial [Golovinomyces cichoracearum]